jgi:hypothetical protein
MKVIVAAVFVVSVLQCRSAGAEDLHALLQRRDVAVEAGILGLAVWTLREGNGELGRCFTTAYFNAPGVQYYFLTSAWLARAKNGYDGVVWELERQCARRGAKRKSTVDMAAWKRTGEPHSSVKEQDASGVLEGIVGALTAYTRRHDRKQADCIGGVSWSSAVLKGTGEENTKARIVAAVDGLRSECVPGSLVGSADPALPDVPALGLVAEERLLGSGALKDCGEGTYILDCMMAYAYRRESAHQKRR